MISASFSCFSRRTLSTPAVSRRQSLSSSVSSRGVAAAEDFSFTAAASPKSPKGFSASPKSGLASLLHRKVEPAAVASWRTIYKMIVNVFNPSPSLSLFTSISSETIPPRIAYTKPQQGNRGCTVSRDLLVIRLEAFLKAWNITANSKSQLSLKLNV